MKIHVTTSPDKHAFILEPEEYAILLSVIKDAVSVEGCSTSLSEIDRLKKSLGIEVD